MTSLLRALHRSRQKQKEIPLERELSDGIYSFGCCDSVGIRTRGLLLRRQLLYPAELRNQPLFFMKSAAKVGNFSELHKFQTENLMYDLSSKELFPMTKDFVALKRPIFSGSLARCSSRSASASASVGASCG